MNIKTKWKIFLLSAMGGILFPMGYPMKTLPHFLPFSITGMALLFMSLPIYNEGERKRDYIYPILTYSFFYYAVGFYWIPQTITEFGGIPFPLNQILGSGFSLIIAPQLYVCFGLLYFLKKKGLTKKYASYLPLFNLLLALSLTLGDAFIPQEFPSHIGHTWKPFAPYLGLAPIFGVAGYSFISFWLCLSFASYFHIKKWDHTAIIFSSLFVLVNMAFPLKKPVPGKGNLTSTIRIVQPNIGNFTKINSEMGGENSIQSVYHAYIKNSIGDPVDLIIWPETSYPHAVNSERMKLDMLETPALIAGVIKEIDSPLFWGGYDKSHKTDQMKGYKNEYNATFLTGKDLTLSAVYHKRILIPFGEGLPFGPLNPALSKIITNVSYFAEGDHFSLFKIDNGLTFISAICYEILFSPFIRDYFNSVDEQPAAMLNVTNDSWYGHTSELWQHQLLAHWRALEFQVPIIRATNTGITSILHVDGSESEQMPLFRQAKKDYQLTTMMNPSPTLFQRFGLWTLTLLFSLALGFVMAIKKLTKD